MFEIADCGFCTDNGGFEPEVDDGPAVNADFTLRDSRSAAFAFSSPKLPVFETEQQAALSARVDILLIATTATLLSSPHLPASSS
jgi:hypothetical protein